ncbi:O-acyltransferase like protein-like [Limulus polyphemus]|uniref:O-acyltransferase like protein-like n=1 Tax=Limulus polyphemus TaxID=6850 RepID=A0ABM1SEL4_LIMPO|nr:O-acyltransferase like protein-like [Limulus polyphemus]
MRIATILVLCCCFYGECTQFPEEKSTKEALVNTSGAFIRNQPHLLSFSSSSIIQLYEELFESLQLGPAVNVSDQCANSTYLLRYAVQRQEPWALRMIDALGKPSSGILEGNVIFLGYYSECLETTAVLPGSTRGLRQFWGKYCLPTLSSKYTTSAPQEIPGPSYEILTSNSPKIGLCVPSTCSLTDVSIGFNRALQRVSRGWTATISHCYTKEANRLSDDAAAVSVITLFLVIIGLIILGTTFDIFSNIVQQTDLWFRKTEEAVTPKMNTSSKVICEQEEHSGFTHKVKQVMIALSLKNNLQKILSTSRTEESIDVLHGIRFLTIIWIITGHSCSFALRWLFFRSSIGIGYIAQSLWLQPLVNGTLSVDTFFFISGFLVTLLTLKQLKKSEGKFQLGVFYIHRYWRMTPLMMIIIVFSAVLLRYLVGGPECLDTIQMYDSWCKKNWWLNALYLQNFINTDNMCLSHSWYTAVDFQFYLVSPLIIYPLYRDLRWGALIWLFFFIATSVLTGMITATQDLPPVPLLTKAIPETVFNSYSSMVYIKPYCRMGPYLVGMALGYILFRTGRKVVLKTRYTVLGWSLAVVCNMLVLYGMWPAYEGKLPSNLTSAMYSALARTAWAVGLAWLTFACTAGYGGFITTFLSWKAFIPFSRLTYSAYLIHPVAMAALYGVQELTVDATYSYMMYLIFGNLVFTFILAFISSLFFEFPFAGLEKVILRKTSNRL